MQETFDITQFCDKLYREYHANGNGVSVNFRKEISFLNSNERYTHSIHSYPAKLISHIPFFFINNEKFIKPGEIILDPFCGSGTTLLEANIKGIHAFGADANPLARLISKCKTEPINLNSARTFLYQIVATAKSIEGVEIIDFKNIDMWFSPRVKKDLSKLYSAILNIRKGKYQDFYLVCFSSLLRKTSYTDPRIAVPVRININRYPVGSKGRDNVQELIDKINTIDAYSTFESICLANIKRFESLLGIHNFGKTRIISRDARRLTENLSSSKLLANETIDMILTSPPYASAQKYIRSSSISLYWLNLLEGKTIVELDSQNIGRENYKKSSIKERSVGIKDADEIIKSIYQKNPLRGEIVSSYLLEMEAALDESVRVLKHGKYLVLIVGNNNVSGYQFNTKHYLSEYLRSKGMHLELELIDDIKSYGLMTKRNKTANIITREWILVFKKT